MTTKPNPLAVMDHAIDKLSDAEAAPLDDARAAVAELVESCRNLLEEWDGDYSAHSKFDPSEGKHWEEAEARFRAALAAFEVTP